MSDMDDVERRVRFSQKLTNLVGELFWYAEDGDMSRVREVGQDLVREANRVFEEARLKCVLMSEKRK